MRPCALIVAATASTGCWDFTTTLGCQTDLDCASTERCHEHACVPIDFTFLEDFESVAEGQLPADWDGDASFTVDSTTFSPNHVLATPFNWTDQRLHYVGAGATEWSGYELRAELLVDGPVYSSVGVFVHAQPGADTFYELSVLEVGKHWHLDSHGGSCSGQVELALTENAWWHVKVSTFDDGDSVRVSAAVWLDGTAEPEFDCVEDANSACLTCTDSSEQRLRTGTIGVAAGNGNTLKAFDNLGVRE